MAVLSTTVLVVSPEAKKMEAAERAATPAVPRSPTRAAPSSSTSFLVFLVPALGAAFLLGAGALDLGARTVVFLLGAGACLLGAGFFAGDFDPFSPSLPPKTLEAIAPAMTTPPIASGPIATLPPAAGAALAGFGAGLGFGATLTSAALGALGDAGAGFDFDFFAENSDTLTFPVFERYSWYASTSSVFAMLGPATSRVAAAAAPAAERRASDLA